MAKLEILQITCSDTAITDSWSNAKDAKWAILKVMSDTDSDAYDGYNQFITSVKESGNLDVKTEIMLDASPGKTLKIERQWNDDNKLSEWQARGGAESVVDFNALSDWSLTSEIINVNNE